MTHCQQNNSPDQLQFPSLASKPVVVEFSAGAQSSDTGLLLLAAVDRRFQVTSRIAGCIPDPRQQAKVRHSMVDLVRQRVFQIAAGYEDCNDADDLRADPALKLSCGRLPSGHDLASQPTLSRLENSICLATCGKIAREMIDIFISCHGPGPRQVIIDLDATDDPLHGNQQLRLFRRYYDDWCYLPLVATAQADDGDFWPLFAWLRPAIHGDRWQAGTWLLIIARAIDEAWPQTKLIFRADCGFAAPDTYRLCEENTIAYLLGIGPNKALMRLASAYIQQAKAAYQATGQPVAVFGDFFYRAVRWRRQRRVVVKAEVTATGGLNVRFVVTNMFSLDPEGVWRLYCKRGDMENRIKELKLALRMDKTSCHRFAPNAVRVLFTAVAYLLYVLVRMLAAGTEFARAQVWRLRERLVKVGGWMTQSARRVLVRCPSGYPWAGLWVQLCRALG